MTTTISRRTLLRSAIAAGGATALWAGAWGGSPQPSAKPLLRPAPDAAPEAAAPNIVLLYADDMNDWGGWLRDDGHPFGVDTPNLDALAADSVSFQRAYCTVPKCLASRDSTLHGLRPTTMGVYGLTDADKANAASARRANPNLFEVFGRAGYTTMASGKIFHSGHTVGIERHGRLSGWQDPALKQGSNTFNGLWWQATENLGLRENELDDHINADWAIARLAESQPRPFLLAYGTVRPHLPWVVPQRFLDRYPPADIAVLPEILNGDRADLPRSALRQLDAAAPVPQEIFDADPQRWANFVRAYMASMSFADFQLGRVLDALAAGPHADNTIVVMLSDHGYSLGQKGAWQKDMLHENSIRVPLLLRFPPGLDLPTSGREVVPPVSLLDLAPTLCDAAGIDPPAGFEGMSLAPIINADPINRPSLSAQRPPIISAYNRVDKNLGHAVRFKQHHLLRYHDGAEVFYDVQRDPNEWTNLLARPAAMNDLDRKNLGQARQALAAVVG